MQRRIYAPDMTSWTTHLPDEERSSLVEDVCRLVEQYTDTGDMEPLVRLIHGWRATAEVHADPSLRALLALEHVGPPVRIVRPAIDEE